MGNDLDDPIASDEFIARWTGPRFLASVGVFLAVALTLIVIAQIGLHA